MPLKYLNVIGNVFFFTNPLPDRSDRVMFD